MTRALVVYCTRTGNTKTMAEGIGEGIRFEGSECLVADVKSVKTEKDLEGYDAYIFGSATYHGEMMPAMKTMLFMAEKAHLSGKLGGAFGAYGWSGEAPERIYSTMKNIFTMDMMPNYLRQKSPGSLIEKKVAQDYGREIGRRLRL